MDRNVPCRCPEPVLGALPQEIVEAAEFGDLQDLRAWLNRGGDINAATTTGQTLLLIAAEKGKVEVLKELLKYPTIHLNSRCKSRDTKSYTPLWWASTNGHWNCVDALLYSNLKCSIDVTSGKEESPVVSAAKNGHWHVVNVLLPASYISPKETALILNMASYETQWDVVLKVVFYCKHLNADILNSVLLEAYGDHRWEVICKILKKNFRYRRESIVVILLRAVEEKNWERVKKLMEMLEHPKCFDMDLVKAALGEEKEKVNKLLDEKMYDDDTADSNFVVITAGGTSDEIAEMIFNNRYYRGKSQEIALLICSLNGYLEFLQQIFGGKSGHTFSYQSLSRAMLLASKAGHQYTEKILLKNIEAKLENLYRNY